MDNHESGVHVVEGRLCLCYIQSGCKTCSNVKDYGCCGYVDLDNLAEVCMYGNVSGLAAQKKLVTGLMINNGRTQRIQRLILT